VWSEGTTCLWGRCSVKRRAVLVRGNNFRGGPGSESEVGELLVVGGLFMMRVYGGLSQVCGSLALAVLLVGLAAWSSHAVGQVRGPTGCRDFCKMYQNNEAFQDCFNACMNGAPYVCGDNRPSCQGSSCIGTVGVMAGCGAPDRKCGDTPNGYLCAQYCFCKGYGAKDGGFVCHCINK
jgi:hypothetical protein